MDSILLFPPGASGSGSQLQLGTYLMGDPGADYGAKGLLQSLHSGNALADGGRFSFRYAPVRSMSFPLLLKDVPGLTLRGAETLLREWSTPGAYVAVQPETVPSGQAVFFDVVDGRWEPDYNLYENRAGYRRGTLFLDTQPFGYWPTEILLASSASVGFFGQLAVNGASVLGDVPPLAHISITPTVASQYPTSGFGPWLTDMVAISLSARPSFNPFIPPASFNAATIQAAGINWTPTLTADPFAPASQALRWVGTQTGAFAGGAWLQFAFGGPATSLEPAYRGRFRVFSLVKTTPTAAPIFSMVDAVSTPSQSFPALATSSQLATFMGNSATSGGVVPSPAYWVLDMGEVTLPPVASGVRQAPFLRFWTNVPCAAPSGVSVTMSFGGLWLQPVDGAAGVLARGMAVPSIGGAFTGGAAGVFVRPTQGGVEFNGNAFDSVTITKGAPPSAPFPAQAITDGRSFYRGLTPRLGASTTALLLMTGDRLSGATYPVVQANLEYSQVSVSYRPTFSFLHGI